MIIAFTGTQTGMSDRQMESIAWLLEKFKPSYFRHGDCKGADEEAHEICRLISPRTIIEIHPGFNPKNPDDTSKRAFCVGDCSWSVDEYLLRNKNIVDWTGGNPADLLIATPSNSVIMKDCQPHVVFKKEIRSGTWATIRYARKQSVPRIILAP